MLFESNNNVAAAAAAAVALPAVSRQLKPVSFFVVRHSSTRDEERNSG